MYIWNRIPLAAVFMQMLDISFKSITSRRYLPQAKSGGLRTLGTPVGDDAMVDVLGMCLLRIPFEGIGIQYYIY